VTLVAGDNASGKSLLIRVLASWLNDKKVEPIQVSMRYRTASGMHRAFMFGDEQEDSTGNVSLRAIRGALGTAEKRESPCWVLLDEPDTGLSEGYAEAFGTWLSAFGNRLPLNQCRGLVIVTHSRALLSGLVNNLELVPHFVCFDQPAMSLQDWLKPKPPRTVEELLALPERSVATFRKIAKLENKIQAEKSSR
jgi:hypothetical protein